MVPQSLLREALIEGGVTRDEAERLSRLQISKLLVDLTKANPPVALLASLQVIEDYCLKYADTLEVTFEADRVLAGVGQSGSEIKVVVGCGRGPHRRLQSALVDLGERIVARFFKGREQSGALAG